MSSAMDNIVSSEGYLHFVHVTSGQVQTSKSSTSSGARVDIGLDPSKTSKCSVEDQVLLSCYHPLELRMRNDFSCYTHPTSSSPMYLSSPFGPLMVIIPITP